MMLSMKKLVSFIMFIICILVFSSCYINKNLKKATNSTFVQKEKNILEFNENILLDNKPVLNMSYNDVIKNFGKADKVKTEKILFPASSSEDYNYVCILSYDGIDFEFGLGLKNSMKPIEECSVWRFDITSYKYSIGHLKVGMRVKEYQEKFGDSKIYALADLATTNTDKLSDKDAYIQSSLRKLLITSKPKEYYSMYENVSYQQGVLVNKMEKI